jgi:hypothetical protein
VILVVVAASQPLLAADQTGTALVDKLSQLLNKTATSSVLDGNELNKSLSDLYAAVNGAKWEHRVDDRFHSRYTRVLEIFKLAISTEDISEILHPLAQREYVAFVKDVTGRTIDGEVSMPVLAQAITQELESMKKSQEQK